MAWLDVTRDGEQPPEYRRPWALAELADSGEALRALRTEDASGRAVLERLIDPAAPTLSDARLRDHARRLDRGTVLDPFLDASGGEDGSVTRLADALSLVRWWR